MKVNQPVSLLLNLAKLQSIVARKFDSSLGGISLSEFMILLNLAEATEKKLRRIDLANKVGLTASGITRLLLPMEKIGLVKREIDKRDARASYVLLAASGKRTLEEALERADLLVDDFIPSGTTKQLGELAELINGLSQAFK